MASYLILSPFHPFINANKRIKGIQIGGHEIKIVNLADDTVIFLRHITCLDRIEVILKLYEDVFIQAYNLIINNLLYEDASSLNINF